MALDETISAGQAGHITDHQFVHGLMNSELVAYVQHGATAGTARPTVSGTSANVALWDGSVVPTNAVDGDLWWDTDSQIVKRRTSGSFGPSGAESAVHPFLLMGA